MGKLLNLNRYTVILNNFKVNLIKTKKVNKTRYFLQDQYNMTITYYFLLITYRYCTNLMEIKL